MIMNCSECEYDDWWPACGCVCVCTGVWPLKWYESTFVSYCMPTMWCQVCAPVFPFACSTAPTGAPDSVRALTTGSTTIHLQWSPPPSNTINGVPLDYVISYGLANSGNSRTRVTTSDTRTRYEFTNLKPYTKYSFRVAIRNSIGTGPYSQIESTVTATDGIYFMNRRVWLYAVSAA